jgi:hypothetical protein
MGEPAVPEGLKSTVASDLEIKFLKSQTKCWIKQKLAADKLALHQLELEINLLISKSTTVALQSDEEASLKV